MALKIKDVNILEELEHLSDRSLACSLHAVDDDFWSCFGFIPSETYAEVCCAAKREEIKADAFKDVLVEIFQCLHYFVEHVDSSANTDVLQAKYKKAMKAAQARFEQLEDELNMTLPAVM
jgi:hypothetical protein